MAVLCGLRLILAGVFDRLPGLQIILGHMGEMVPFMLARIQNSLTPVARHLQRPVPGYFRTNFHFTTSGFFTEPPLVLAIEVLGVERILFAVDYPFSSNEQGGAALESISISPDAHELITHRNAGRLLRLPTA